MTEQARIVQVYRSSRRDGMYLFVDRKDDLREVPQPLLEEFGRPEPSLVLHLTPNRKLQRAEAPAVLAAIRTRGYYLQMPPAEAEVERQILAAMREQHG